MTTTDWWDRLYDAPTAAPATPTAPASRLPDWRKGGTVNLGKQDDDGQPAGDDRPAESDTGQDDDQGSADQDNDADQKGPAPRYATWLTPAPDYYPTPRLDPIRHRAALSPAARRALYNLGAAGAGHALGLAPALTDVLAQVGTDYSISGALIIGPAAAVATAHLWDRRTRHWWPPLAWTARIPLASTITALALYTPASL